MSKDPIGLFGGYNTSAYVSDPTQWVDPMGLMAENKSKKDPFRILEGSSEWLKTENVRLKQQAQRARQA
jgi:uncharacterized protein RhaS with RHS repeats